MQEFDSEALSPDFKRALRAIIEASINSFYSTKRAEEMNAVIGKTLSSAKTPFEQLVFSQLHLFLMKDNEIEDWLLTPLTLEMVCAEIIEQLECGAKIHMWYLMQYKQI